MHVFQLSLADDVPGLDELEVVIDVCEDELQDSQHCVVPLFLQLNLLSVDVGESDRVHLCFRAEVLCPSQLGVGFEDKFSLLFELNTISALLVLKLLTGLVGVHGVAHFFLSELDDVVLGQDALFELLPGDLELLFDLMTVLFVVCTLPI